MWLHMSGCREQRAVVYEYLVAVRIDINFKIQKNFTKKVDFQFIDQYFLVNFIWSFWSKFDFFELWAGKMVNEFPIIRTCTSLINY